MGYKENVWLEKYEIKKPDYDWIERNHIGMKDVIYEPSRYVKKNNVWVSKRKILNFFGKRESD